MMAILLSSFAMGEIAFEEIPIPYQRCRRFAFDVFKDEIYVACYHNDTLSILWTDNGSQHWHKDIVSVIDTLSGLKVVVHRNSQHVVALIGGNILRIFYRDYGERKWHISNFVVDNIGTHHCYICGVWDITKPLMDWIFILPLEDEVALAYQRSWSYPLDSCAFLCGGMICGNVLHPGEVVKGKIHHFVRLYGHSEWVEEKVINICGAINNDAETVGRIYTFIGLVSDGGRPHTVVYEWLKLHSFYESYLSPEEPLVPISHDPEIYDSISSSNGFQFVVSKINPDSLYILARISKHTLEIAYVHNFHLSGKFVKNPFSWDFSLNFAQIMDSVIVITNGYQYAYSFNGFNTLVLSDTLGTKATISRYENRAYLMWADVDTAIHIGVILYKERENKRILNDDVKYDRIYDISGRRVNRMRKGGHILCRKPGKVV